MNNEVFISLEDDGSQWVMLEDYQNAIGKIDYLLLDKKNLLMALLIADKSILSLLYMRPDDEIKTILIDEMKEMIRTLKQELQIPLNDDEEK